MSQMISVVWELILHSCPSSRMTLGLIPAIAAMFVMENLVLQRVELYTRRRGSVQGGIWAQLPYGVKRGALVGDA